MLGPPSGLWHSIETPPGKVWVHRRYDKDMAAADMAIAPVINN